MNAEPLPVLAHLMAAESRRRHIAWTRPGQNEPTTKENSNR